MGSDAQNDQATDVGTAAPAEPRSEPDAPAIPVTDLVERLNTAFAADLARRRAELAVEPAPDLAPPAPMEAPDPDRTVEDPERSYRAIKGIMVGAAMGVAVWGLMLVVIVLLG